MAGRFLSAFAGGMLSFLSPCVLPLVPAYLSIVAGVSVEEVQSGTKRLAVVRGTALFMSGFTIVFVALGATASAVGAFLLSHRRPFEVASGVLVIVFGVFLAGAVRPSWLEQERRFHLDRSLGTWGAPLLGGAFAFGWTPCIGPILGTVLTLAAREASVAQGVLLLFGYSLGLGIPFLLSGLALSELSGLFGWVKRHFRALNLAAGAILVVFGVLLLTNQVTRISGWIQTFFEWIGLDRLTNI